MRISITPSLLLLAISSGALAQLAGTHAPGGAHDLGRTRKTLAFGPDIPHAVFNTQPSLSAAGLSSGFLPGTNPSADPLGTASTFVWDLLSADGQLSDRSSFELRSDSYTDDNTGVTHAYFRQVVNGLTVSDGLINVNVKDGVVLSYGDSVSVLVHLTSSTTCFSRVLVQRGTRISLILLSFANVLPFSC